MAKNLYEWICAGIEEQAPARIAKLESIKAPAVIIDATRDMLQLAQMRKITIGGDKDALELNFLSAEKKSGNGGTPYWVLETVEGINVNYFPRAKYGRFIKII